jgi:hypothetical protein
MHQTTSEAMSDEESEVNKRYLDNIDAKFEHKRHGRREPSSDDETEQTSRRQKRKRSAREFLTDNSDSETEQVNKRARSTSPERQQFSSGEEEHLHEQPARNHPDEDDDKFVEESLFDGDWPDASYDDKWCFMRDMGQTEENKRDNPFYKQIMDMHSRFMFRSIFFICFQGTAKKIHFDCAVTFNAFTMNNSSRMTAKVENGRSTASEGGLKTPQPRTA